MKDTILYKSREVKHCPPHFIKVPVEIKAEDKKSGLHILLDADDDVQSVIRNWLHENCEHRFYIGQYIDNSSGVLVESFIVSFEDPADATYFTLLLSSFTEKK